MNRNSLSDAELTKASTAQQNHLDTLMNIPQVIGVGIGKKDGHATVVVMTSQQPPDGVIPTILDDVEVVIQIVGDIKTLPTVGVKKDG